MTIVKHFQAPPFRESEVWRYSRAPSHDDTQKMVMLDCCRELFPLLQYQVCYKILPIARKGDTLYIDELEIRSSLLDKALTDCDRVVIFAATVGLAPDRLIRRYSTHSPAKALLLQAIGTERVEGLCDAFEQFLKNEGYPLRPRVSPGYGDLPLALQRDLFRQLDCGKIGLTLGDNLLMTPSKSVTAFIGVKL